MPYGGAEPLRVALERAGLGPPTQSLSSSVVRFASPELGRLGAAVDGGPFPISSVPPHAGGVDSLSF
jgi:hypothetical protein